MSASESVYSGYLFIMHKNIKRNPVHIHPEHLLYLSKQCKNVIVSPKADGVYSYIDIGNNLWVMAEHMKEDYYLVFDTSSYPHRHNNNYHNRLQWLRDKHPFAKELSIQKIHTIDQFKTLLRTDTELLSKYLKNCSNKNKYKWYPKYGVSFDVTADIFLDYLDYDISSFLSYDIDGLILTPIFSDRESICKYKPVDLLTVDLHVKNGIGYDKDGNEHNIINTTKSGIWRCYWNIKHLKWEALDLRKDKLYPNKSYLVNQIEKMHHNKWRSRDLIPHTRHIYYDHIKKDLDDNDLKYLNHKKDMFKDDILELIHNNLIKSIIDIGCGKGKLADYLPSDISLVGVDIDPYSIHLAKSNNAFKSYRWVCGDMNNINFTMKPFDNTIQKNETFDMIIYSHSAYYTNITILIETIKKYTHINSSVYISFIDADGFKEIFIKDNFWIKIIDNKMVYSYPWLDKSGTNSLVSSSQIINNMEKNGYVLENKYLQKIDTICVFKRI